jgi:putative membrane protein
MMPVLNVFSQMLIGLVALEHIYILWIEMFAWTTTGPKVFRGFPKDLFEKTKSMAANQGLYNGFLAAGLIWSLITSDLILGRSLAYYFLACVIIAGIYGAVTVSRGIFYKQALPAIVALLFRISLDWSFFS